jgi:hypothetical protein
MDSARWGGGVRSRSRALEFGRAGRWGEPGRRALGRASELRGLTVDSAGWGERLPNAHLNAHSRRALEIGQ